MSIARTLATAALMAALPALADFNDKQPINATVTGATPSGYPRTMVEGVNAVVRDVYPGAAVCFSAVIAGTMASRSGNGIDAPSAFKTVRRERARFEIIMEGHHSARPRPCPASGAVARGVRRQSRLEMER